MQKSHGLLLLIPILLSTPAIAVSPQPWQLIKVEDNGNKFYMNIDAITRRGAIVSFTAIDVLAKPDANGSTAIGFKVDGNCAHNQIRYTYEMLYDSQMNPMFEKKGDRRWRTVGSNTAAYAALRKACAIKKR